MRTVFCGSKVKSLSYNRISSINKLSNNFQSGSNDLKELFYHKKYYNKPEVEISIDKDKK